MTKTLLFDKLRTFVSDKGSSAKDLVGRGIGGITRCPRRRDDGVAASGLEYATASVASAHAFTPPEPSGPHDTSEHIVT